MTSRTTGILVGASLFAFVMFSSCGGMMGKGGTDSASMKEALEKAIANNREVTVASGGYKVSIPNEMVSTTELNDDASLQYQNTSKELYIIVIDESKTDFIKTFSDPEMGQYDDKITPVENYRTFQLNSLTSNMTTRATPVVKKAKINGLDAEIADWTASVPGIPVDIYYRVAFVEGTKNLYMVMTWTLASDKTTNSDQMDQMIQSFKLAE
jgi:hypothetical protein